MPSRFLIVCSLDLVRPRRKAGSCLLQHARRIRLFVLDGGFQSIERFERLARRNFIGMKQRQRGHHSIDRGVALRR